MTNKLNAIVVIFLKNKQYEIKLVIMYKMIQLSESTIKHNISSKQFILFSLYNFTFK